MTRSEKLARLAEACGIVPHYTDIWNRMHRVSDETKQALLAAMGHPVDDDAALDAELREVEERPWRRLLGPVHVEQQPFEELRIPLHLRQASLGRRLLWRLREEEGREREAVFTPGELERLAEREVQGELRLRCMLVLREQPSPGYHTLEVLDEEGASPLGSMRLIVAPPRCFRPPALEGDGRVWGPAVQLYALRSSRNWGIGDFSDLRDLVGIMGRQGAGIVGVNPLHLLFGDDPLLTSPYSPSSRSMLNDLYLAIEAIPDFAECSEARRRVEAPDFRARLVALRHRKLVSYGRVTRVKREVLEILYRHFRRRHLEPATERGRAFRAFQADRGAALEAYGTFEALREHFRAQDSSCWGWPVWPEPYRRPDAPEVAQFVDAHRERVEFYQYLQWQSELQLEGVGRRCLELRLNVGLYQDLAVSTNQSGFDAWWRRRLFASGATYGAPPDDFNLKGQDWGLVPWIPERLREAAYEPFVECLRASMRHAGALRVDHVMGLMRAYWVPGGRSPLEGAYVRYDFQELLGILALESQRNRCMVIGEDLGTVPDEVRQALEALGTLCYRLFYFSKESDGSFTPPARYPTQALVAASTHDLPTLPGFWSGRDLTLRSDLGLFPEESMRQRQLIERAEDRTRLLLGLEKEGLLPEGVDLDLADFPEMTPELVTALHVYLARSPAKVVVFQLEDVLGQLDQVNLPGTADEYPNWRRKLALDLEQLEEDSRLDHLLRALRAERGEGRPPRLAGGPRLPLATYRLQLGHDFGFAAAADLVPYLHRLGISHCYASPFLAARPGSPHGYDIIDHHSLNPEFGTAEEFDRLVAALRERGMGLLLDLVPNHMGIGSDNQWWLSVLEHGRASPYADFFDIDWDPRKDDLRGKVLLPCLEDQYGEVLERGLLRLRFCPQRGSFEISYRGLTMPVDPNSYPEILGLDLSRLRSQLGPEALRYLELESLITAFRDLPPADQIAEPQVRIRLRDTAVHKARLAGLQEARAEIRSFIDENVALINGVAGSPQSFDRLDRLLAAQNYRVAFWRVAADEINYRRFFDINDLAGLKIENPAAFESTHRFVLELIHEGKLDGLRIDHPDGLHDPAGYYRRLRAELGTATPGSDDASRPDPSAHYIVAEKILAAHERLPQDWPIDGTTGYDFCNLVGGLFVDASAERAMDRIYTRFVGRRLDFEEIAYQCKRLILRTALASELSVLSNELDRISEADRKTRDFTWVHLRRALAEVISHFPVYRTYVGPGRVTDEDRRYIEWAISRAKKAGRAVDTSIFDFIEAVLTLQPHEKRTDQAYRDAVTRFAMKFQQATAPVMAKGVEDTAFYIYHRLLCLNEVGGDPKRFGVSVSAFHRAMTERAAQWPSAMLNTSTHDSKRSEDVRARIGALTEIPERWQQAVTRWSLINRSRKRVVGKRLAPSKNDEYAIYQTLLGIWPLQAPDGSELENLRERVRNFVLKAVREAKQHSSWINPDADYEQAALGFVDGILAGPGKDRFLSHFVPFQKFVSRLGLLGGLAQLTLKLSCPGVPDLYQGNETWHHALVDPDNRRPVDFAARRELLAELESYTAVPDEELPGRAAAMMSEIENGRIKLYVTWRLLHARREMPGLFRRGDYLALEVLGDKREHVCSFSRRTKESHLLVVVPRLVAPLCDVEQGQFPVGPTVWGETRVVLPARLAATEWRDLFTGRRLRAGSAGARSNLPVALLLESFPVAVLIGTCP